MPSDASLPLATSGRTGIRRRSFVPRATDRAPDSDEGIVLKNRQPAEWSPHQSVWTAWPSATDLWLDDLAPAREEVGALIRAIDDGGSGEIVEVLAANESAVADAEAALRVPPARAHHAPFGDLVLQIGSTSLRESGRPDV